MGRIENYDNDSGISNQDRLFGTSYEGIVDGKPVYKTKNYLMGEVISKVVSQVESAGDRWDVISYKFTPQMVHDLGDAGSGVLDLDPSSSGNNKHWVLIPGVANKILCISNIIFYLKSASTVPDATYLLSLASYSSGFTANPGNILYNWYIYISEIHNIEQDFYITSGSPIGDYYYLVGKPLMLRVQNSELMTEGDNEIGIWIEYKYLDFNTDF